MTTKPPSTVFLRDQTHCDRIGYMAMQPLSLRVPWVHYIITEMKVATDLLEDRGQGYNTHYMTCFSQLRLPVFTDLEAITREIIRVHQSAA